MLKTLFIAGLLASFCFYKGLIQNGFKKGAKILKTGVIAIYTPLFLFIVWGLFFYYLESIPLSTFDIYEFYSIFFEELPLSTSLILYFPAYSAFIAAGIIFFNRYSHLFLSKSHTAYGTAHFANKREIKKNGFLDGNDGSRIILGRKNGEFLTYPLTNHMLMFAPSRSGKGVSVVIPNALNWKGSLLCTDNKYEIFKYTSGYRKKCGNEVYRFSPASEDFKTHCINPLDFIDKENPAKRVADLQLILDILIQEAPGDNKMWAEEARSLTTGLLLWLLQSDKPFTLSELAAMVKGQNLDEHLTKVIEECVIADNLITIDIPAYIAIQNFLQKADKEQSGVRSTLTGMLRAWEDPMVCAATDKSDFNFKDMRKRPISLYLSFGTAQISRLAPVINLVIQVFLATMLDNIPEDDEPHKVLCLLDEINRFGRMDKLKDGFGDLAGYGVHQLPIIQNVGQFFSAYGGRDECDIFFQNTDLKVCFRQNAQTDQEFVSKELGTKTVRIKTRSYATNHSGSNYSESFVERPLLTPHEVKHYPKDKQILITSECTIECQKIIYYKDKYFAPKLLNESFVPAQTPSYPSLDVIKNIEEELDEASEKENEKKQLEQIKAREIGQIISKSLAPLIEKATSGLSSSSDDAFDELAKTFYQENKESSQ